MLRSRFTRLTPRGVVNGVVNAIDLNGEALNLRDPNTGLDRVQAAMNTLAVETGGRAFYKRNELDKVIADSVADGVAYYTLGYYPTNSKWDGKFRTIDIKLGRPGLQ